MICAPLTARTNQLNASLSPLEQIFKAIDQKGATDGGWIRD